MALVAALPLLAALAGGCLITDDFGVFSGAEDGGSDGSAVHGDGPTGGGLCSCSRGMTTKADCDPCAHRECDGCHFGACVLDTGAACEYRSGLNSASCGSGVCRRCTWPKMARRFCSVQCKWSECQCCGEVGCEVCE